MCTGQVDFTLVDKGMGIIFPIFLFFTCLSDGGCFMHARAFFNSFVWMILCHFYGPFFSIIHVFDR